MVQTETASPQTGSIADVAARLALWGRRAPKGLARVEFVSDFSRQEVVAQLRATLPQHIPVHEIELPFQQSPIEVVYFLRERLRELLTGVVSVTGFATAFSDDCPISDALRLLNFHRENLTQYPFCQIWWMTPPFAETFLRSVPDLDSWFMQRLNVTELIVDETEELQSIQRESDMKMDSDEARKQSREYVIRFDKAVAINTPASELIGLAIAATSLLYDAGLQEEERLLIKVLLDKMTPSLRRQGIINDATVAYNLPRHPGFVHGMDYYGQAHAFRMLAQLYERLGKSSEAEEFYISSLNITENVGRTAFHSLDFAFQALAQFYLNQDRYIEAEALCRRWLGRQESISGPESYNVIYALDEMLEVYLHQGHYQDAERIYYRMLNIARGTLLPDKSLEKTLLSNLANLYIRLGRNAEAEVLIMKSTMIQVGA